VRSRKALAVLRVGEIGEGKWPDLLFAVAQHLAQRTVGTERSPAGVHQHDTNRRAVKDGRSSASLRCRASWACLLRADVAPGAQMQTTQFCSMIPTRLLSAQVSCPSGPIPGVTGRPRGIRCERSYAGTPADPSSPLASGQTSVVPTHPVPGCSPAGGQTRRCTRPRARARTG